MRIAMQINFHQMKRFILSGGSATLLHYSVMALLIVAGIDPVYATAIGALCGAIFNYILQYHYTFKSDRSHSYAVFTYSLAVLFGLLSNELIFVLFYNVLNAGVIISQLIATAVVTIQNYLVYKYLVFSPKRIK